MCKDYSAKFDNNELSKEENNVIEYFEKAQKAKVIYFPIHKYFKYMCFSGIGKRKYKEIMLLHFPILSYIFFKII